ncbi:unnamed protein product [Ilex paraguariensis]|uniref:Uncharacterized protein n=1 Tax=Ilex paraguariensis TaxID=185542 RepID=A0ABC8R1I1_9AQUA
MIVTKQSLMCSHFGSGYKAAGYTINAIFFKSKVRFVSIFRHLLQLLLVRSLLYFLRYTVIQLIMTLICMSAAKWITPPLIIARNETRHRGDPVTSQSVEANTAIPSN